jgi:hypothetical protein
MRIEGFGRYKTGLHHGGPRIAPVRKCNGAAIDNLKEQAKAIAKNGLINEKGAILILLLFLHLVPTF